AAGPPVRRYWRMGVGVFRGGEPFAAGGTPPSFSPLPSWSLRCRRLRRPVSLAAAGAVAQAVAAAGDGDHLGVVQEAVEDGGGGGHVADELAPVLQRAVAGHHGRADLVASHDDL